MPIPLPRPLTPVSDDLSDTTLREGPPTLAELAKFYPANYTWEQLKSFLQKDGDLGLLKRHPELHKRYEVWAKGIKEEHGSVTNYLINVRLGFNTPQESSPDKLPYFTADASPNDVRIILNDWPYSIPLDVSHFVIWTRLPVVHRDIVDRSVWSQVTYDGLWGYHGMEVELFNPDGYNYTDVRPGTAAEDRYYIRNAAKYTEEFIAAHWPEEEWELMWFVNPPRLQSIRDLDHIHVFARRK